MTPQGLALISLFCIALTIAVIYDHNKAKKKGAELEEKYQGHHAADFKFGGLSGYIADNMLVFKTSMKGYVTIDLTKVKYISAYSVNGATYVSFADENNKEVISKAKLGALGTKKNVEKFLHVVCENADWIQWS